jgi:CHAT domain-containing protein
MWLLPTSIFSRIPLHAAGIHGRKVTECLADYVVTSYTPTIGILLLRRQKTSPLRANTKVLIAGVPTPYNPQQWSKLHFTTKEVSAVKEVIPPQALLKLPPQADCTLQALASPAANDILTRLPEASIFHLACHGHQDRRNPLNSGFVLGDRMLTVAQLTELDLPNAWMAFLSACETAKGDETLSDEAVHLAASMLFAGFQSVIGTMW